MTRLELFQILRPIILKVTGVPEVILNTQNVDDQAAKAPTGEYCSVEPFQSIEQLGRGTVTVQEVPAEDGSPDFMDREEALSVLTEATVSVNFYRGASQDYAHRLRFCDQRSDISDTLFVQGISWKGTSQVNNLTTLNSGRFEPRSQISIRVQQIYSAPWIIEDEDGNEVLSGDTEL